MKTKTRIVTIDGPAGAGKTSVSKLLSQKLDCIYVDTGALYRGIAYEIQQQAVDWENDSALKIFLNQVDLKFMMENEGLVLRSSGRDISKLIRTPEISMLASATSANPLVREALLTIQHHIAEINDAVFEGRDMGTVVFPDAAIKFFLFADLKIRAKRRFDEMSGSPDDIRQVEKQMKIRDRNDSQRDTAPLIPAEDAIRIDASLLTIEQVVEKMIGSINKLDR